MNIFSSWLYLWPLVYDMEVVKMQVWEFLHWDRLQFKDRMILKSDLRYMSIQQICALEKLEVLEVKDKGNTLVIERR